MASLGSVDTFRSKMFKKMSLDDLSYTDVYDSLQGDPSTMTINFAELDRVIYAPPSSSERAAGLRFWNSLRDLLMRVAVFGESTIAKTRLIRQYRNSQLGTDIEPEPATSCTKIVQVEGKMVRVQVYDGSVPSFYMINQLLRNSCGAVILFDLTERKSFTLVQLWYLLIVPLIGYSHAPVVFIGCRGDGDTRREVSTAEAEHMAKCFGCMYYEVSTITANDTSLIFSRMAHDVAERLQDGRMAVRADQDGLVANSIHTVWTANEEEYIDQVKGPDGLVRSGSRPVPFTGRIRRRHPAQRSQAAEEELDAAFIEANRTSTLEDEMIFPMDE